MFWNRFGWLKDSDKKRKTIQRKIFSKRTYFENSFELTAEQLEDRVMLSTIQVFAAGATGQERMELQFNGATIQSWSNVGGDAETGQFLEFSKEVDRTVTIDRLRVAFTNDAVVNGQDRNLRIDAVAIDGIRYETEGPGVISTGTGNTPGSYASEYLFFNGYFQYSSQVAVGPIPGVAGKSLISANTKTVAHSTGKPNTVIIAGTPSLKRRSPGFIQVDDVDSNLFEMRFQEWKYLDERHSREDVSWLAIPAGRYESNDGSTLEVGVFDLNGQGVFNTKKFSASFETKPLLFLTSQTANGGQPAIVRSRALNEAGFQAALYEEEALSASWHTVETIGYLAIQLAAGSGLLTIGSQSIPYFSETIQISNDVVRSGSFDLTMQEEQSADNEVGHAIETANVLALGDSIFANVITRKGVDPVVLRAERLFSEVELPAGFVFEQIGSENDFEDSVALEVLPDGRVLVAQENGVVWNVVNGVKLANPYIDLSAEVLNEFADNGALSGLAIHPNFGNGSDYIYLLYTTEEEGQPFGRLVRYTQSSTNPDTVNLTTRTVLIGKTAADGLIKDEFHNVGDIEFGSDRTLLFSWGDTAGNDENDPRHLRSQDITLAAGAIFRINANNGRGLATNPFYTGNPNDIASKVWAYGLRNGFRFDINRSSGSSSPGAGNPGTLYIGEVGRYEFDELNISKGGENFGWPYYEGNQPFRSGGESVTTTAPTVAFAHPFARSVIGGSFYNGTAWPAEYQNQFFLGDFVNGWIYSFKPDVGETSVTQSEFGGGIKGMTDMKFNPITQQMLLVGRGKDIIFSDGEGLDGLYVIRFAG